MASIPVKGGSGELPVVPEAGSALPPAGREFPTAAYAIPAAKPWWLQTIVLGGTLLLLVATYLAGLRVLLETAPGSVATSVEQRDAYYFAIHGVVLALAVVLGFVLGRWVSDLGMTYAAAFLVALFTVMAIAQLGSYELACRGHNDLVRHWTCDG